MGYHLHLKWMVSNNCFGTNVVPVFKDMIGEKPALLALWKKKTAQNEALGYERLELVRNMLSQLMVVILELICETSARRGCSNHHEARNAEPYASHHAVSTTLVPSAYENQEALQLARAWSIKMMTDQLQAIISLFWWADMGVLFWLSNIYYYCYCYYYSLLFSLLLL